MVWPFYLNGNRLSTRGSWIQIWACTSGFSELMSKVYFKCTMSISGKENMVGKLANINLMLCVKFPIPSSLIVRWALRQQWDYISGLCVSVCNVVKQKWTLITKSAFKDLTYPNKKISKNLAGDHLFSTAGWLGANRANLNCFTACTNQQLCPWHHIQLGIRQ